ncbi:hypothetical protein ABZV34_31260 [Streptomyces sp. NPDC005195]|uniref:hypothetical protein n=1 Tax=Streptomyces sp. NPDC005195 TaxID=3154561 RepID=UPI0033A91370
MNVGPRSWSAVLPGSVAVLMLLVLVEYLTSLPDRPEAPALLPLPDKPFVLAP